MIEVAETGSTHSQEHVVVELHSDREFENELYSGSLSESREQLVPTVSIEYSVSVCLNSIHFSFSGHARRVLDVELVGHIAHNPSLMLALITPQFLAVYYPIFFFFQDTSDNNFYDTKD